LNSAISKLLLSVIFALPIFIFSTANAEESPFNQKTNPTKSYTLAEHHGSGHGMKKMDANGDGELSKEEFMAHKEMKFMMKDKNGDGKLTADEMKGGKHGKWNHGEKKSSEAEKLKQFFSS